MNKNAEETIVCRTKKKKRERNRYNITHPNGNKNKIMAANLHKRAREYSDTAEICQPLSYCIHEGAAAERSESDAPIWMKNR